ncbi:hypothetical protein ACQQ2Q_01430 [Agrobacterium sp. ES01]
MSPKKPAPAPQKSDLVSQYRPVGLKAVAAAALMLKRKPKPQPA